MQLATQELTDYNAVAKALAQEFATTAAERDAKGGTAQHERDQLRQSGLLKLMVPQEYGGIGTTWVQTLGIVREFAKVDSSIAHIFSYHHLSVVVPHLFGTPEQKERYYLQTTRNNWFWCNAFNPLDRRVTLTAEGKQFRLNGTKSFCSGSKDSDLIPVSAVREGDTKLAVVVVPTARAGITVHDDWDNMGQRQTDSGSITFDNVLVEASEILGPPGPFGSPFGTLRSCLTQITFANIYLGIAQGAFAAAKQYTASTTRPWLTSGVEQATEDPYILQHYGEMWTNLSGAEALVDKATQLVQTAWEQGEQLTAEQRGECALAIAIAKISATRIGLDVTSRIFEVMGSRSTAAKYRFDRYWRNLRTFTLHDPVDYKVRDVGDWALNDQLPTPNFYS
ncbi:acyl-CoA dehydrogenase family protein [Leptolyngbya sp. FACHB-261]|uniref:acyl-CoA dehydrogenase family protein n=1 Tax=Leptolyngbya sp. FACHB-261 TaxID=2692806 RepID=UPI001685DAA4|nr:acyl-CoA dehydrogenase family protein [Leptolyngbya sp. FACHB-261]MBD2104194.1 acyl-CoA dehydrogenase family protein [Leptolyngbya sp. FACHB-261]